MPDVATHDIYLHTCWEVNAMKLYRCSLCHQVFLKPIDKEKPFSCCDHQTEELEANLAKEEANMHRPHLRKAGNFLTISVANTHPMVDVHHIKMIVLKTNHGFQYKHLDLEGEPKADFILARGETIENAYVYCNVHMLWSLY